MFHLVLVFATIAVASAIAAWIAERARRVAFPLVDPPPAPLASFATALRDPLGLAQAGILPIGFMTFLFVFGGGLWLLVGLQTMAPDLTDGYFGRAALVLLLLALVAIPLALRAVRHRRAAPAPPVVVHADRLVVPVAAAHLMGFVPRTYALGSVRAFHAGPDAIALDLPGGQVVVPRSILADPAGFQSLAATVHDAIDALPQAGAIRERAARDREQEERLAARAVPVSSVLRWALVGVFALQALLGFYAHEIETLVRMGAMVRVLVLEGEVYRLVTASYLHAGLIHLWFNLGFIALFAPLVERLVGRWVLLALVFVSGPAGAAAAALVDPLCVGSSTVAFGLFGATAVIEYRHADRLPPAFRLHPERWLVLTLVNVVLPLLIPQISWAGHLGGVIAGAATARLLAWDAAALEPAPRPALQAAVVVLALAHAAAIVTAALRG